MASEQNKQSIDRASNGLTDFSASRIALAGKCGLAFEYKYVRRIPAVYESARAMFGNVIHDGTQEWYGDYGSTVHQQQDLAPIVLKQWERLLPPVVWEDIQNLRQLNEETDAVASAILFQRPELKSPRTTKAYLAAEVVQQFTAEKDAMVERCDALETIKWPKDEDPYKAYVKSAELARQMQKRWQSKPRPLFVEKPFRIEIDGFSVRGRIDQYRIDPLPGNTGEVWSGMLDIKTGLQAMTQMEAFLQSYIYGEAIRQDSEMPDSDRVAFYLARHDKYQQGRIEHKRHAKLASRILQGKARQIIMGQFEPSYGFWCKQCDFNDLCSSEISLWSGDGLVLDLMANA